MVKKNHCITLVMSAILFVSSYGQSMKIETNGQALPELGGEKSNKNIDSNTNQRSLKSLNYEITKESYIDKDVKINYPQITNLTDRAKQEKVNDIIKNEALKGFRYYPMVDNELSLTINYEIKRKSENLLSIQYSGIGYVKNAAHPNNIFYTTNININEGIRLRLKDMVNIDESFVEKFKEASKALQSETSGILDEFSNAVLIKMFSEADSLDNIGTENQSDTFSYLTKDSLGISVSVPHALGDHTEFEINYRDIAQNIKF
jgi:hypothetical protein